MQRDIDFGSEINNDYHGFADEEYDNFLCYGNCKKRKDKVAELVSGGMSKSDAKKKALELFPKDNVFKGIKNYYDKNKSKIDGYVKKGTNAITSKGSTSGAASGTQSGGSDNIGRGNSPAKVGFWNNYKVPVIIGSSLLLLGVVVLIFKNK